MIFKLNRLDEEDIFYLAAKDVKCLGETLMEGTFNEAFTAAAQLEVEESVNLSDDDYTLASDTEMTGILDAKWFLIDLNKMNTITDITVLEENWLFMIVRTTENTVTSLPTGRFSHMGTLNSILNDLYSYVSSILDD